MRLDDVDAGAAGYERRLDAPLVGRERESATLEAAIALALGEGRCGSSLCSGPRGSASRGSRARSARVSTERRRVVSGRCLAYGGGITYWPLVELVRGPRRPRGDRGHDRDCRRRTRRRSSTCARRSETPTPPPRATSSSGESDACSRQSPATGRCSSASRTSTGPSPRCSISSSTSWPSAAARSSCCATRARTSWRRDPAGPVHGSRARTAVGAEADRARRGPGRHGHGGAAFDRGDGGGQPTLRRAARRDGARDRRRRGRDARAPGVDPRAARRPPRRLDARRAPGDRARFGDRQGVLAAGRRGSLLARGP